MVIETLEQEVMEMAKVEGYTLEVVYPTEIEEDILRLGSGFCRYDLVTKKIIIGINEALKGIDDIYIHELLHAKHFFSGGPMIQRYTPHQFSDESSLALSSLSNIAHHTFIYPQMEAMGYTRHIDNHRLFLAGIIEDCDTNFEGIEKIYRALYLVEAYIRNPSKLREFEPLIKEKQPTEYALFRKFLRALSKNKDFPTQRRAFVEALTIMEEFALKQLGLDIAYKTLNKIEMYLPVHQFNQKASTLFYTKTTSRYPVIFLMGKSDNQCCAFINSEVIPRTKVDELLNQLSAKYFFEYLGLPYKEVPI